MIKGFVMSRRIAFMMGLIFVLVGMLGVALELKIIYASPYIDIDVDTAYNMITNGTYLELVVLDVRTQSEVDVGHIYDSFWIPHTELEARIGELAGHEDHEVIVYCLSGVRSAQASGILDTNNFTKVYNMLGGITEWQSAGNPVWIATVHNLNTTFNYDTIQAAVDAPQTLDGHTILAEEGTYYENVVINKPLSLLGENRSTTIIDANVTGHVIEVKANNTRISGLTIRKSGCGCAAKGGVYGESNLQNLSITNNLITQNGFGVRLVLAQNISLARNNIIDNAYDGVYIYSSSSNTIIGNNIENNSKGILLFLSSLNTVSGNNISKNNYGIWLHQSSNSGFYHNNLASNTQQVFIGMSGYANFWDDNIEGNYWSNYTGADSNHDGIGDTAHVLDAKNVDHYPLMGMFKTFNTSLKDYFTIISNSTVEAFTHFEANSTIKMQVSNMTANQTFGFCRISIPHALMNVSNISVVIDSGSKPILYQNYTSYDNGTHRWIYFAYEHSTLNIVIVPELPILIILPLFMTATLLAAQVYRRKREAISQ